MTNAPVSSPQPSTNEDRNGRAIGLIEAAISNMATSRTALGFYEPDMKGLARIVFANWKYVEAYHARLTERCEQYKGQVKAGSDEIDALRAKLAEWKQAASVEAGLRREFAERILELEGAIKPFADLGIGSGPDSQHDNYRIEYGAIRTARSALSPDGNSGEGK